MAKEFKLTPIITGGQEADLAAADLKAAGATVIFNLDFPTRPKSLAPDADEPVRELRLRAHAPKVPAGLEKAGVQFAFSSSGLTNPSDFVKNAARAVKEGLNPDAAVRALTLDAARIAGAADRLGSLEKGKIANIIVTDGDLFAEKTAVKVVLIDGRRVDLDAAEAPHGRGRGGR
jgi:imidazolonepropionase-like amidohydrolase